MSQFPCVVILGARQVGKSTLLRAVAPQAEFFDMEASEDWARFQESPDLVLSRFKGPIIIDKAQRMPKLFPALRVAIDKDRQRHGRFLLSGSSSPELNHQISESLAGRVAIFELGGLSLDDMWSKGTASRFCRTMAEGGGEEMAALAMRRTTEELFTSCVFGGYPEPVQRRDDRRYFRLWMDNYIRTYLERDVRDLFPSLQLDAYRTLLNMLGHSSGRVVNASEFARSLDVSQPTVRSYLGIAEGTFLWRSIQSYDREIERRVTKMPKGYLRDTGLVGYMLRFDSVDAFLNHPDRGRIWESYLIEEIIKGFQNRLIKADYFYYRTHNGAEIDLIVETNGRLIPVEIKISPGNHNRGLRTLTEFAERNKSPFAIVLNTAEKAGWLNHKVLQIPAGCL